MNFCFVMLPTTTFDNDDNDNSGDNDDSDKYDDNDNCGDIDDNDNSGDNGDDDNWMMVMMFLSVIKMMAIMFEYTCIDKLLI